MSRLNLSSQFCALLSNHGLKCMFFGYSLSTSFQKFQIQNKSMHFVIFTRCKICKSHNLDLIFVYFFRRQSSKMSAPWDALHLAAGSKKPEINPDEVREVAKKYFQRTCPLSSDNSPPPALVREKTVLADLYLYLYQNMIYIWHKMYDFKKSKFCKQIFIFI